MIAALLALTLFAGSPASAEPAPAAAVATPRDYLGPTRRAEIDLLASDWVSYKSRAYRMSAVFTEAAVRHGYDRREVKKLMTQIQDLMRQVEDDQYEAAEMAREKIRASAPPSPERLQRESETEKIFRVRALTVYANMLPRILDEWEKDAAGNNIGRTFAGPEWAVLLTFDEGGIASRWHVALAGFTIEEYREIENRAADALGHPRGKTP